MQDRKSSSRYSSYGPAQNKPAIEILSILKLRKSLKERVEQIGSTELL